MRYKNMIMNFIEEVINTEENTSSFNWIFSRIIRKQPFGLIWVTWCYDNKYWRKNVFVEWVHINSSRMLPNK